MKRRNILPRILRITDINEYKVTCIFNTGEKRMIDFGLLFNEWEVREPDPEYVLKDPNVLKKVSVQNGTLSWEDIKLKLKVENGQYHDFPYEPDPDTLYEASKPVKEITIGMKLREARLKARMSQEDLANRSGTNKFYISRIENDRSDIELMTLRKIVEGGLGKTLDISIV